ncbi:MAG TPA: hypothetical protein VJ724_02845, partial [Tahibacter sp.]|nr:hypothetical protein [Tahibacter sp.]
MTPNFRFALAGLALIAALPGIARGSSIALDSASRADARIVLADADAAGNTWALGDVGYLGGYRALLRYPAGATTPSVAVSLDVPPFVLHALLADADGGATIIGLDDDADRCLALHYDVAGRLLWQTARPRCDGAAFATP